MPNALTLQEMNSYAQAIVNAGFCGFNNTAQVITLALVAQDEGRSIGSVARDYHVINGRPTLKADAMLARYQSAGGKVEWKELSETRCAARFSHPSSGSFELEWTIEQAQKAGITGNPTWKKYPRAMLRARVISEGVRTSLPAVLVGIYTPEEAEDMEPMKVPDPVFVKHEEVKAEQIASPYKVFYDKLVGYSLENPDACQYVKEEMAKRGWIKPADVPASEYENVYLWYETAVALGSRERCVEQEIDPHGLNEQEP